MQLFPQQASSFAGHVDALYGFLIVVTAFFSLLIGTLVVFFAIRYRRRSPEQVAVDVHESMVLEVVWTVIPIVLTLIIFFWGASVYFRIVRPPANTLDIYVTGKQWMWKLQHTDGHREMNELHVPIGQPVRLVMASEDVIHSFYVPAFRFKRDVVPGRLSIAWFEATRAGRYHLFCAQYCGTHHSGMIGWIYAMPPADYQAWLSGGAASATPPPPPVPSASRSRPATPATATSRARAAPRSSASSGRRCTRRPARRSWWTRRTFANRSSTRRPGSSQATRRSCRRSRG